MHYTITNLQARQFMLLKHGLIDVHRFQDKQGVMDFIRQAGCIQYDPVDVCGKNAELTLQSRIKGFTKVMLNELLYKDRLLVDYPDKQLAIILTTDWPYFERYREIARKSGLRFEGLDVLEKDALAFIKEHGIVSSSELPIKGSIEWQSAIHWSGNWEGKTNVARSVLEQLYSTGELIIHHKRGTRKYYDLATNHLPAELLNMPDPLSDDYEHMKWRVLRRIGAVGILWNRPSDAWLRISGLKSGNRTAIFKDLIDHNQITSVTVEGIKDSLYFLTTDIPLMERVLMDKVLKPRMELIAPLDCFLWDRKLINALFNFLYKWEIYTPAHKRRYGAYVLPLLYGNLLIGRVKVVNERQINTLVVKNIWLEEGIKYTKKMQSELVKCLKRFATFNECQKLEFKVETEHKRKCIL